MRPGLWEVTTASDLLRLVPQIQPEQMRQLESLSKRYGLELPRLQDGAAVSQVCITPEMAASKTPPNFYNGELGCAATNVTRSGDTYRTDLVCNGAQVRGTGKAEGRFTSAERFEGRAEFTGAVQGTPVSDRSDITGRWIGQGCGTVKPMQ
ncbi:MAG: hypothetical protein JWR25_418 [Noviherbaspirillum sp.]|jgi:hypothetical protein|nr:hypothetical protein [Noviherbaspirillum sp.]